MGSTRNTVSAYLTLTVALRTSCSPTSLSLLAVPDAGAVAGAAQAASNKISATAIVRLADAAALPWHGCRGMRMHTASASLRLRRRHARGAIDHVGHGPGLGHEHRVARGHRRDLGADALGHVLQHGLVEGLVLGGAHRPARSGAPGRLLHARGEHRHVDRHL